jgi:DNA (cytosine-5)-methyltransferase 1
MSDENDRVALMRGTYSMIDLFSGCGGLTRGFLDTASFRVESAVEMDLHAASTYAANFGESHMSRLSIEDYEEVPEVALVIGGPPCQGFSNLGKKDPEDLRNGLWREFSRVVRASKAQMFVFENVDRFSRSLEYELLSKQLGTGRRDTAFDIQLFTLNAADFGTPQRRIRTIIVGSRLGPVGPPAHSHSRDGIRLPKWRTVREALQGRLSVDLADRTALPAVVTRMFGEVVPGLFSLQDIHIGRNYRKESLERYSHIPPGGNRFLLPEHLMYDCWKKHKTGAGDVLGRLEWDSPSVTIRTEFFKPEKGRYLHPEWHPRGPQINRALSHAEAALIQGFDERHLWCGSKIEIARQIGNAVPPPLASAVADLVRERLKAG